MGKPWQGLRLDLRRKAPRGVRRGWFNLARWPLALLLSACASSPPQIPPAPRAFDFNRDTFAFANELLWAYCYDADGRWTTRARHPEPTYHQHCFAVARSAKQFFEAAQFDPSQPVADEATYRRLIRRVVAINPRKPVKERIVIPGYPDLRTFSRAWEELLKAECGPAMQSYVQRGNWRVILPFSRRHQARMARQLQDHFRPGQVLLVHAVRFPQLTINHFLVIFAVRETSSQILFNTYDPNQPGQPTTITYDRGTRTFSLPRNAYFPGGRVDLYEVCHRWNY